MNADTRQEETANAQTQRLAALGFMLAGVCREISSPLAAVYSILQILQSRRGVTPETMEKGLASMSANLARVLAITKKLGDFSRLGTEPPGPVRADAALEEARALLRNTPSGAGVRVQYRGLPDAAVLARPGDLPQILFNVLLNAAQAMGGTGLIQVQAHIDESQKLALSIRDGGPGIPAESLARVFEPFFSTKAPGEGTGLGLAISYELVHELGGTIRAFNPPGGGACFELVLPLWAVGRALDERRITRGARPLAIEEYIREVIERFQHSHSETELAKMLGIGRKALWMRRRQWGLKRARKAGV